MTNIVKDANNKTSSKRVAGFGGFFVAAFISIYGIIQDPSQAQSIIWPWIIGSAAMLGVTVLEKKQ